MIFGRPFEAAGAGNGAAQGAPPGILSFGACGDFTSGGTAVLCVLATAALVCLLSIVLALGMLPAEARREREIPLELVSVSMGTTPPHTSAHVVVVHVGSSGRVRVGGSYLPVDSMEAALLDRLERLTGRNVARDTALTVRADAKAPYGLIAKILAAGRKAGIRKASLLTVEGPAPRGREAMEPRMNADGREE